MDFVCFVRATQIKIIFKASRVSLTQTQELLKKRSKLEMGKGREHQKRSTENCLVILKAETWSKDL